MIRVRLQVNVLAIEYPQYENMYLNRSKRGKGVEQPPISVEQILDDCLDVYHTLKDFGVRNHEIIIQGRSIGTGIAIQLVTEIERIALEEDSDQASICCLILMSPFVSIRSLARDIILSEVWGPENLHQTSLFRSWCSYFLSFIVRDRLNSAEAIASISCPCFIIHGLRDSLVPYTHAKLLHDLCGQKKSEQGGKTRGGAECSFLLS